MDSVSKKIIWSKTANSDDADLIGDKLKGVSVLLDGLLFADSQGENQFQKYAYSALNDLVLNAIQEVESLKTKLNYMEDCLREK